MTPEGWGRRRVREFCERLKRINYDGIDLEPLSITKDRGVILQSEKYNKRIATDPKKYVFAEDGDFAFDPMSLYYGAIGRVAGIGRGLLSPDYVVFNADETVDGDFLHALLRYPEMHKLYESLSETGNTFGKRRRLYWSIFEDIELALPPLPEQRKIAAILSSVDDAIKSTQAVIDQLGVVKKAMTAELLTRGLPGKHTTFKQTEIGEVPADWTVLPIGEVFEVQLGKMMSAAARSGASQFPYLRNENVYWHRLELSDVSTMVFDERERAKFRLRKGDLLACEGRHIGRCAVWSDELDECYYQKALHRLRPISDAVTTRYMKFFMALRFRYQTDLVAEANTTSTIPHLPREKLIALRMWFPPRREQDRRPSRSASRKGEGE